MRLIHTIKEMKQSALEDGKFQVTHKWRFKHASVLVFYVVQPISENASKVFTFRQWQMSQLHDYSVLVAEGLTVNKIVYMMELVQKSVKVLRKKDISWLYKRFWKFEARSFTQFLFGDVNFHLKHKRPFKTVSVLTCVWEHVVAEKFSAGSVVNMRIMSRRDHNHFSVLLEQRGVMWLWVCSDFTMSVADTRPE